VGSNGGSGSRFSQWFKRESPPLQQQNQQIDSLRSTIQDELLNNLLNDISEPNIHIPSVTESNTYFAPISPAANTHNNIMPPQSSSSTGIKLLEMLQRNSKPPNQNGQGDATSAVIPMMKNSSIKEIGELD
jgi:translation initiation factor 4E transporter